MEITVISEELIKPSSPLPDHLKTFKLCLFDQITPRARIPIILYYSQNINTDLLKNSLSRTLTLFYPLAGKIKDDASLDSIGTGALFVEARVNCSLSELLSQPHPLSLRKLLPCEPIPREAAYIGTRAGNIQLNRFKCGGVAIGICLSHKIVDGCVLSAFLKAWSAVARGEDCSVIPDFSAALVFPTNDSWLRGSLGRTLPMFSRMGKCVTNRFLFDPPAIAALKDQARSLGLDNPSRVEVVSSFMWNRLMAASQKLNKDEPRPSVLTFSVNLRGRMRPPMPENSVGNIIWVAAAQSEKDDRDRSPGKLAGKVRKSLHDLQSNFIEHLRGEEAYGVIHKAMEDMHGIVSHGDAVDGILITSWCRFGYNEVDFGQGKPVWASLVGHDSEVFMNIAVLVDTMNGGGIEAWIMLDEKEMNVLEVDEEMGKYAVLNPSPLSFVNGGGNE